GRAGGGAPAGRRRTAVRAGSTGRGAGRRLPRHDPGGRMNTVIRTPAAARPGWRRALRPYAAELQAELRRAWRTPAFAVPSLLFYLLFGVLLGRGHAPLYLLATYCVFGAMAPALFGFGVQLALDREGGLLTLKRALPMPAAAPLLARLAMAVMFALLVAALLI